MEIKFTVNGQAVTVDVPPEKRAIDVLRKDLGLIGTKFGCGEGECGACTIILNGRNVNSCLIPAFQLEGTEIVTIEAFSQTELGQKLERSFLSHGAVQCGYCIPGMVISSGVLLTKNPHPTEEEIRTAISGNICRCTGYKKIIQAVEAACEGDE